MNSKTIENYQHLTHRDSCIIIGAGEIGKMVYDYCIQQNVTVNGIYDENPTVGKSEDLGAPVYYLENLTQNADEALIMCTHRLGDMHAQLTKLNHRNIVPFPIFLYFRFGHTSEHPFYKEIFSANRYSRDLLALRNRLNDERSLRVLDAVLAYRSSFDVKVWNGYIDPLPYFSPDILSFSKFEHVIDGGAFAGDSIVAFKTLVQGSFSHLYAFEPDSYNFSKLEALSQGDPRITPIQAALHSQSGEVKFGNSNSRCSSITNAGDCIVRACSIDDFILSASREVTFIKLNIEGAELEALRGAKQTITSQRPRLAIAIYHRPTHLWEIPMFLWELSPDYKFFIRHHSSSLIETVLYAVPA